jgi:hypothetical protein
VFWSLLLCLALHRIAPCHGRTYERRAKRITSSWSGPSYGGAGAPHVRHFIVHTRRAGHLVARPLNCGVMRLSSVIRWLLLVPCAVAAWYFAVVVSVVLREIVVGRCLGSDAPLPEYLVSAQILGLRATFPRCRLICGSCGRGRGCGGSLSQIACRLGRSGRRRNTGDRHGVQYGRRRGSSRGHSFRCSGRCCHASHYHRIARCKCRTYERRAKRITSSWSGPSYVVAATSRARHFIMRSRRASDGSVRPLNCGVSRQACIWRETSD